MVTKSTVLNSKRRFSVLRVWILWVLTICMVVFCAWPMGYLYAASPKKAGADPLPNWNDGQNKQKILTFVQSVCDPKDKNFVPAEDRIATFDMDGTIVCEKPLWLEVNVAQDYLWNQVSKNPALVSNDIYRYVYNYHTNYPTAAQAMQNLENNCVAIMTGAFTGWMQEDYVEQVNRFCATQQNPDYKIQLQYTFYQPMLELIDYLLANEFQVYIVSGSEQGLIWGACEGKACQVKVPLPRKNMVGSSIQLTPKYKKMDREPGFIRGGAYLDPRNLKTGKSDNIYYRTGKTPIFACGNTADDFDMLSYSYTNRYPHIGFLVDHDDKDREYVYPDEPTMNSWKAAVSANGWNLVSMAKDFKTVFVAPK